MRYRKILVIMFSLFFLIVFLHKAYADEIEQEFKDICTALAGEFSQTLSPIGKEYKVSDKEIEDTFTRQRRLFKEWQEELRKLIKVDPHSVWADDAQYIIATLSIEDPKQQAIELEYLIDSYADIHIEDWTKNVLPAMIPAKVPITVTARLDLINDYKQLGDEKKAEEAYNKSISEYPEYEQSFKRVYTPKKLTQEETEKARENYNENVYKQKEQFK